MSKLIVSWLMCAMIVAPGGIGAPFAVTITFVTTGKGATVIVKVVLGLVSTPPLVVPPLSTRATETSADPVTLLAGVKVSAPLGDMAGWVANNPLLLLLIWNVSV